MNEYLEVEEYSADIEFVSSEFFMSWENCEVMLWETGDIMVWEEG